jgi:hypothetical protein
MRITHWFCLLSLLLLFPAASLAYGHYTVYSTVPADVYVDNEYRATISATQTLKLILSGPQSYVIGVRAKESGQTYKETVFVGTDMNEHRDIRAFTTFQAEKAEITVYSPVPAEVYINNVLNASVDSAHPLAVNLPGPRSYVFEVRARDSNLIHREELVIDPRAQLKREVRAFPSLQPEKDEMTVYSPIPADVYVDNILNASVDSTHPLAINLPGPRSYVFEVRAKGSNLIHREEVNIDPNSDVKKEIRAFSDSSSQSVSTPGAAGTAEPAAVPQGGITREEMAGEIAKAKTEALAEEAARRKRAEKRELTSKGIAHVVGVEANQGLPGSVKNMERIKLLMEALPSFKK